VYYIRVNGGRGGIRTRVREFTLNTLSRRAT
jgi:hypothetical protein